MTTPSRSSLLNALVAFLGLSLLSAAAMSAVAAWLAYLQPVKGIDWKSLAALAMGLLVVTGLIFSVAWYRIKNR